MRAHPAARRARDLAGVLLTAAALAGLGAVPPGAAAVRVVPASVLSGTGVLNDVTATSAHDAWAVGHLGSVTGPRALIEHWNGRAWRRVALRPASGWLDGVAAASARDVWAVGFSGIRPLLLHYDGTAWSRVASPALPARSLLADVTAISPHDVWAVGAVGIAGSRTLIEHWNGTAWRRVPAPSPGRGALLSGVSAASARDAWAVGGSQKGPLALHWNGSVWRRVPISSPGSLLERVTAISATEAWSTGSAAAGGILIEHWNGRAWRRMPAPALGDMASLVGVSATSARDVWAVGDVGVSLAARLALTWRASRVAGIAAARVSAAAATPLILHWNGKAWTRASVPVPAGGGELIGVRAASGRSAWAVGCTKTFTAARARPLVLRWNGATWQ